LVLCLVLGVVMRIGSYLDLAEQTKSRRRWRHLCALSACAEINSGLILGIECNSIRAKRCA